jgi:8-oxo-dGTP diphosphatase
MPTNAPVVATIVVIFAIIDGVLQVLLVHRDAEPDRGLWALPGGRWDGSTGLEEAATAKLVEETGARGLYLEQLFTASSLDATQPSLAVAYFALVDQRNVRLRTSTEWPPGWHRVDTLEPLAFHNNDVIAQAVARVRAKLEYTTTSLTACCPSSSRCARRKRPYEANRGPPARPPQLPQAHAGGGRDLSPPAASAASAPTAPPCSTGSRAASRCSSSGGGRSGSAAPPPSRVLDALGFDAIVAAVVVVFFFWGLADGSVSSFNITLWLGMLAGVAAVVGGSWMLHQAGQTAFASIVLPRDRLSPPRCSRSSCSGVIVLQPDFR